MGEGQRVFRKAQQREPRLASTKSPDFRVARVMIPLLTRIRPEPDSAPQSRGYKYVEAWHAALES
jgi:hypothetical protein